MKHEMKVAISTTLILLFNDGSGFYDIVIGFCVFFN